VSTTQQACGKPALLRVDYDAGHTGFDATRAQSDSDTADMRAFALCQTENPDFQHRH
jgi:protease II